MKNLNESHGASCDGVKLSIAYKYEFLINDKSYIWESQYITGEELHALAGTSSQTHFISNLGQNQKKLIGPEIKVDLTKSGVENFLILPFEQQSLDLHDCYTKGSIPYITYEYLIKVNQKKYAVQQEKITGEGIIRLISNDPANHRVRMFTSSGKVIIKNDQEVDLTNCGVERFVVEPLSCTEGYLSSPALKQLLPEDIAYLESFSSFNCIHNDPSHGNLDWVIIRSFSIPEGYNVEKADVAILLPKTYPAAGLDMVYFHPHLNRLDNKPIGALNSQTIEGKSYQRWSRHRVTSNRWNPEIDNLESHVDLMVNCLKEEFKKR